MSRVQRKKTRKAKIENGEQRVVTDKFMEQRRASFQPVKPLNDLQATYISLCREMPVVLATGFPGTSKTYIPTCVAAELWFNNEIDKIYLVRPAVSSSKSLGYFSGSLIEKSKHWLGPILDTLIEKLGKNVVELAISSGQIEYIPLETIKGRSLKDCFIIVDESEDLKVDEFVKCITRLGENATMVFAGDILQSDLHSQNGLTVAVEMAKEDPTLPWGFVEFDRPSDIVRSDATRKAVLSLRRKGLI